MSEQDRNLRLKGYLTTKDIEEIVLKHHNYDGAKFHKEIQLLYQRERAN